MKKLASWLASPSTPLVLVSLASALLGACSSCGGDAASGGASGLDRTPASIPDEWVVELAIGGDAALARVREALPEGAARTFFPTRVVDVVDAMIGLPAPLRDAALESTPLRCISLGDEPTRKACALRVRRDALAARPGAPRGASWVDAGEVVAALADDVLVVAEDHETLEIALPWLAFTAMTQQAPRGCVARLAPSLASQILRPQLDQTIVAHARAARAAVEQEREAHDEAPVLGEPEAVIGWLETTASEYVALLPDLGETEVALDVDERGVAISLRSEVREGSPLARRLASTTGAVRGLRELPRGTVLAWASTEDASAREDAASALAERLATVAGPRMDAAAREALARALGAWAGARGDASVAAIGLGEQGPWAALATWPARTLDLAPLRDALAIDWADAALAPVLGCERIEPRDEGEALSLCPGVTLARGTERDALALVLARGTPDEARAAVSALASRLAGGRAAFGASPDVERVLGATEPEGTFFTAAVVPSALPALVGGLAPSLRERAGRFGAPRGAPWLVRARQVDGALVVELRASTDAVGDVLALVEGLDGA